MNHKNPDLNIRYAVGIGDLFASIIHSKSLSWLVILLTGKDKPCTQCSKRKQALNILFPIKFWKIFFKDEISYLENLKNFYIKCGFKASLNYENRYVTVSKFEDVPDYPLPDTKENKEFENNIITESKPTIDRKSNHMFLSSNEITLGEYIVRTEYYKKI
jgi:hypothetical protein